MWVVVLIFNQFHADCCQGKCQEDTERDTAQAGPSGGFTGSPANDAMEESAPETSNGETSEMVWACQNTCFNNN